MVKWIVTKSPYGYILSNMAELHDFLVSKGYSYHRTKEYGKNKKLIYKKGVSLIEMVRVKEGLPARRVNIRISSNMTQTRQHGTPDEYKIRKRKVKK
jgi:hypothetical protein